MGTKQPRKRIVVPIQSHFPHISPFLVPQTYYFVLKIRYPNVQNTPIWYPFFAIQAQNIRISSINHRKNTCNL